MKQFTITETIQILDGTKNVMILTDPNGTIIWANKFALEFTGYTKEEMIGNNPRVLKHPSTPTYIYKDMWETIINKKEWKGKLINKKKNGELYCEYLTISPILNENGEIEYFLGIQQDITAIELWKSELKKELIKFKKDLNYHSVLPENI